MGGFVTDVVWRFFGDLFTGAIHNFVANVLNDILAMLTTSIAREHEMALRLLDLAFVRGAIQLAQVVGGALLALKVAVEALRSYILFSTGSADVSPFKLAKRAIYAAALLMGSPWLARTVFGYGATLAVAVAQVPMIPEGTNPLQGLLRDHAISIGMLLLIGVTVVFWLLIYLQSIIRGVEIAFLSVAGPIMAVGLTGADEGAWAVWWRELVVVSMSQAVQMFMLTGFFSTMGGMLVGEGFSVYALLVGVAWLWVAHRSPAVLRQFAYHTGTGSLASTAARTGTSVVRALVMRSPTRGGG